MKKLILNSFLLLLTISLANCAGIKFLTIETQEPAQITLPQDIRSVLVVNNVVKQPDDIGHNVKSIGEKRSDKIAVSSDSVAVYYTEALAQFLDEEEYFDKVLYYHSPLRTDNDFWREKPIMPDEMSELKKENEVDAVISLDKLIITTNKREHFKQEGVVYADLRAKIQSVIRIYMPTLEGQIPAIQYSDSLRWEGYDIQNKKIYAEHTLPSDKEAMKDLVVRAAEKMTNALSPHWEEQRRWIYTQQNKLMQDGEFFAGQTKWTEAIGRWEQFFDGQKNKVNKAKAASNIAFAYEMLGDMEQAYLWVTSAYELFSKSVTPNSLEMMRIVLYKSEIERRRNNESKLDM